MEMVEQVPHPRATLGQSMLSFFLTDHAKRVLLFGSLFGALHRGDDKYAMLKGLADMNERLDLTDRVASLMFAAQLELVCWKSLPAATLVVETGDYDQAVNRIRDQVPIWLRYDHDDIIAKDIRKLLVKVCVASSRQVVSLYK